MRQILALSGVPCAVSDCAASDGEVPEMHGAAAELVLEAR